MNKGIAFRKAHEIVGLLVHKCLEESSFLEDLKLEAFQEYSDVFHEDVYECLKIENVVGKRKRTE